MKKKNIPGPKNKPRKEATVNATPSYGWYLLGVVLITFIVFVPAIQNPFVNLDDNVYGPEQNYLIKSLSWANIREIFHTPVAGNYHPFTILSLAANFLISGSNPGGYHLTNVLLHLGNTALVFFFVYQICRNENRVWIASAVSLLFGIQPMHAESVVWVSARKDVLYTFFFLLTLLTYQKYREQSSIKKRIGFYLLSLLLFLFSLLSKGQAVTLSLVLILIDIYQGRKINRIAIFDKIPFFALSIWFGIIAINMQTEVGAIQSEVITMHYSFWERIMFSSYALWTYIWKAVWPVNLSAYHPYPTNTGGSYPAIVYASPFILAALMGIIVWIILKFPVYKKLIIFGSLFFLVNIALLLQVVSVGVAITAERYTYVAYIGLFFTGVICIHEYLTKNSTLWHKSKSYIVSLLFIYGVFLWDTTYSQNKVWQSSKALWNNVRDKYPDCSSPYGHLATIYIAELKPDSAIFNLTKSIELMSNEPLLFHNKAAGYVDRAYAYLQLRKRDLAIVDCDSALAYDPQSIYAYVRRGIAYGMLRKSNLAMDDFNQWFSLDSTLSGKARALTNIATVYAFAGQKDSALMMYDKALLLDKGMVTAASNRSIVENTISIPKDLQWTTEN